MRFKRIYVEISDYCNLDCRFCTNGKNTRIMSFDDFKLVVDKIKGYTSEICLHVLGEPLVHKDILKILNYAKDYFNIMITTNGNLLNKFKTKEFIVFKKMNISLNSTYNLSYEETIKYLDNVFDFINYAKSINEDITFNLRMWAENSLYVDSHNKIIYDYLSKNFNIDSFINNTRLEKRVILTHDTTFSWPNINDPINTLEGTCKGGKTHIAILADGRVSICCLDASASSNLGNIFNSNLDDILNSETFKNTILGFNQNKMYLDICKRCKYHSRKDD